MKIDFKSISVALLLVGFSSTGWATLIVSGDAANGTDVGSTDLIVAGIDPNLGVCGPGSDPVSEECWAESITGTNLTFSGKEDPVDWYFTDNTDLIAFALVSGPGYYIIKNSTTWVLMENLADMDWGVLSLGDLAEMGFGSLFPGNSSSGCDPQQPETGCMTISHVTEFNGTIPEPGTLLLLGAGLLGIGARRRK